MITYPYEHFFTDGVSVQTDIVITDGTAGYSGTSLVVTGNTVLFTNENIHQEQMSLLESLCSENMLHFGCCEACEFKFTISSDVLPLEGKVLNVYLYFDHDASTLFQIGVYKVASDVGTAQRSIREITCYDALYEVLNADYTDWYNAINYTTINTVKKFRDAFFSHIGITQQSVSLVNDSAAIVENRAQAISGVQILRAICEINGRFGHIGRTGQFEYIKLEQNIQGLYPAIDLYPSPTLFPRQPKSTPIGRNGEYIPPLKYEEYEVPSITRLQLKTTEDDVGVTVGVAGTDYVIQGNFLTFGSTALSTIATNILGEISGVVFQPFEVQMNADLCLEVGDAIRCNDDLTGVEGYVLYRQCVGIQAMRDTFNCHSERSYEQNVNNVSFQFQELNNRTLVLKQDVDGVSSELTYQLDPTQAGGGGQQASYAYQTAQQIGAKVSVEHGDHYYDSFSWDMDVDGHTWYKNNQQVMKIDGSGLTVTGTISGSKFYCGTSGYETTLIDSEGKTARFANNTINFSDQTVLGTRIISADIASGLFHIDYYPSSDEATVTLGNSDVELSSLDIYNPIDMSIRRVETGEELTVFELEQYTGGDRIMIGVRNNGSEMVTQNYLGGEEINLITKNSYSNIWFGYYFNGTLARKNLGAILTEVSNATSAAANAIQWGSSSGIETFSGSGGSGIAINPPSGTSEVHVGYSSSQLTLGSGSTTVRIKGHAVQYFPLTIGNTMYYLLGYT